MKKNNNFFKSSGFWILIFLAVIGVVTMMTRGVGNQTSQAVTSTEFIRNLENEEIKEFTMQPGAGVWDIVGEYREEREVEKE